MCCFSSMRRKGILASGGACAYLLQRWSKQGVTVDGARHELRSTPDDNCAHILMPRKVSTSLHIRVGEFMAAKGFPGNRRRHWLPARSLS